MKASEDWRSINEINTRVRKVSCRMLGAGVQHVKNELILSYGRMHDQVLTAALINLLGKFDALEKRVKELEDELRNATKSE